MEEVKEKKRLKINLNTEHIQPELVESILKTIRFYDLFDFPLMADEIRDHLYRYTYPLHIKELKLTLVHLVESGQLLLLRDYYTLPGRESIVETRKTRRFIAEKFWTRTRLYGQYMRAVPFVKMIAVCNNLAYDNPNEQSDIDLFIVIKSGRMWIARLIITLVLQFYGVRRHGDKVVGRFCLSFFVTDKKLNMEELELKPEDPYLAYWTKNLSPIYGEDTFKYFKELNEQWLLTYGLKFSNHQLRNMYYHKERKTKRFAEWLLGGKLGDFIEWILKKTYKRKTMSGLRKLGDKANVLVSDDILKFHNIDRRRDYYQSWKQVKPTA